MEKILIILTGGTICSTLNNEGELASDVEEAKYKIISNFKSSNSPFKDIDFDTKMPLDILSENMTVDRWNVLLDQLRKVKSEEYKGIIILHGTDTLAYTACLLSLVMAEKKLPVCLVSSHSPLDSKDTNGNINFRASVELIMNGIRPNVYAVYQNSDRKIYVHYGAHLLQCENYSNDFYSFDATVIETPENAKLEGMDFETETVILSELGKLRSEVLYITPVVGMDYDNYNLGKISAVVHGTYHSQTVCVERSKGQGDVSSRSIIDFANKCKQNNVDLFIAPCNSDSYAYESTGDALKNGALPISNLTKEMAYIKILIGCSMNKHGKDLADFAEKSINHEKICTKPM